MKKILKWKSIIMRRIYWLFYRIKIFDYKPGIQKFGTSNFSFIPNDIINKDSIIYSFGAGEDIHWEVDIIEKFNCNIYLFDPTPRSFKHVNTLKDCIKLSKDFYSADSKKYLGSLKILEKLNFYEIGLWDEDKKVKFFEPLNPKDVSHSITNLQQTEYFIEVSTKKLSSIMSELKHNRIDFLKLDIEGAEYNVIENILNEDNNIGAICMEFHYTKDVSDFVNVKRLYNSLQLLIKNGFKIIHRNTYKYFTLIK